ncbi:uncharacterized protein G2W53_017867 [Senna tora]|uniref:Uncharacterized protein n=1 Tax=Senna tora TaxID=362788 RepID=A0A834TQV9_9FABA|nr:uncharacterized protein G2W53_017867 [Senna tora]
MQNGEPERLQSNNHLGELSFSFLDEYLEIGGWTMDLFH